MTDHVSSNAARAPRARDRERDEAAPRARRRRSRKVMTDRDLAELESLLMSDLQTAPSPSIAGGESDNENHNENHNGSEAPQPSGDAAPAHRPAPRMPRVGASNPARQDEAQDEAPRYTRRPQPPAGSDNDNPARRAAAREGLPPYPRWANDGAPLGAMQRRRHSRITRALRVAVTIFSVFALLGVSALLVLLAVGRDQGPQRIAEKAASVDRIAPADENVTVLPPQGEPGGPTVVAGPAAIKSDGSRIAEQLPMQGGGTVRPIEAQAAAVDTAPPAESAPAQGDPRAEVLGELQTAATEIPFQPASPPSPPARVEPSGANAALAEKANASKTAAVPAQPAEPATRDAPVTTHVNLRAKPDNDASVLTVVPAGKKVAVVDCGDWCEVRYDGQQGFVHSRFVKGK